jgi:hypothetical protein
MTTSVCFIFEFVFEMQRFRFTAAPNPELAMKSSYVFGKTLSLHRRPESRTSFNFETSCSVAAATLAMTLSAVSAVWE